MVSKGTNGAGLGTLVPDRIRKQYLLKFAVVVALVVVVTAGVGVYFQQRVSADVTADTHRQLNGVATSEAASLTRWVADRKQIARTTSAATELEGGNRSAIDHELDAVLTHSSGSAQEIHYIDLQTMRILESTNEDQVGQFISPGKVTWMQGSWNLTDPSTVAVSDGYDTANGTVVAFVSRIEGTHKAVMLTYDTTALANGLQTVSGGYTQAVNRDGRIILTENQSLALTTYQEGADSPVLKRAFEGNNGTMNRASTKEVLAYAPVEGTDWAVVAHV
ncbi:MAG: cache domain-containing protein, partial [Halorientalis sp.]